MDDWRGSINDLSAYRGENKFQISDIQIATTPLETVDAGGVGGSVSTDEQITGVCLYFDGESNFVSALTE